MLILECWHPRVSNPIKSARSHSNTDDKALSTSKNNDASGFMVDFSYLNGLSFSRISRATKPGIIEVRCCRLS